MNYYIRHFFWPPTLSPSSFAVAALFLDCVCGVWRRPRRKTWHEDLIRLNSKCRECVHVCLTTTAMCPSSKPSVCSPSWLKKSFLFSNLLCDLLYSVIFWEIRVYSVIFWEICVWNLKIWSTCLIEFPGETETVQSGHTWSECETVGSNEQVWSSV